MDSHEIQKRTQELQINALEWFKRVHFKNHPTLELDHVANRILLLVLSHPDVLSRLTSKLVRYRQAEGMEDLTVLYGWLAGQKQYRKRRQKA